MTPKPLTKPQRAELSLLANGLQRTYGSSRARVQNTLWRMGYARYLGEDLFEIPGTPGDFPPTLVSWCEITPKGRAALSGVKSALASKR